VKAELLSVLLPSSADLSTTRGKAHNTLTSDDINIRLSYSNLTNSEMNFLLAKFLDDTSSRSKLFYSLYNKIVEFCEKEGENNLVCKEKLLLKYIDTAILESIMESCPFCNGTGIIVFKHKLDKCNHCHQGKFIFTDAVRADLIGLKKGKFEKNKGIYKKITEELINIEYSALSKIGDT
jgi:hypothetical protein